MHGTCPILIAGPTASGKSALALQLAEAFGGVIINADSQQIYRDWHILTARPSPEEETRAPHRMYGNVSLDVIYSTGHWLDDVTRELERCQTEELRPIIVGGTGLYFKALTVGLAKIPKADLSIRARGEEVLEQLGLARFVETLQTRDPKTCARIDLQNPRRVLRAWEVLEQTGRGIADWQDETPPPLVPLGACQAIALQPPRDWLYERCDRRFDEMIKAGVLTEVEAVMSTSLSPDAPGAKAVGAPELMAHLRGEMTLDEASDRAKMETRRYAKRQSTWIRNQMQDWRKLDPADSSAVETLVDELTFQEITG
ncbi:MAG: tRNA (adenosine(37)-N6)-dimethylallyltransferase MiaA [Pseudomonadota bacterium]